MSESGSWASLLADTETAKNAKTVNMRKVNLEWYCTAHKDNVKFIEDTCRSMSETYDCDFINIRADVHNTKTVLIAQAPIIVPVPAIRGRVNGRFATMISRPPPVKTIKTAAWHVTLELHSENTGQWTNAHVYCETKEVKMTPRVTVGIATGPLSKVDGKDVPANPEFFPAQRFSSVKSGWKKTTNVHVPRKQVPAANQSTETAG